MCLETLSLKNKDQVYKHKAFKIIFQDDAEVCIRKLVCDYYYYMLHVYKTSEFQYPDELIFLCAMSHNAAIFPSGL